MDDYPNTEVGTEIDDVPVEKPAETPDYPNFCKDEDLVKQVKAVVNTAFERYKSQRTGDGQWDERMRDSDRMYRCGLNVADTKAEQSTATLIHLASTLFFRSVRTWHSNLFSVLFAERLPIKCIPPAETYDEQLYAKQKTECQQNNACLRWTMAQDDVEGKAYSAFWELCKVSNLICKVTFKTVWRKIRERVTYVNADGDTYDKWEQKKVKTVSFPTLSFPDHKDFFIDSTIFEMKDQPCPIERGWLTVDDIYDGVENGEFDNGDKITAEHLYPGEDGSTVIEDREDNSGVGTLDRAQSSLYGVFDAFPLLPIDEKGKWDKKNRPVRHWVTIIGKSITDGVCVRLIRNPYPYDALPYWNVCTLPDRVGFYHFGLDQMVRPNYDELTTCKSQLMDNRTLIIRAPMIGIQGAFRGKKFVFSANSIVLVDRPDAIQKMKIDDATLTIMPNIQYLEQDTEKLLATGASVEGYALGGRTSALEAQNVQSQALKPHIMAYRYIAKQFFEGWASRVLPLWNEQSPADLTLMVTGESELEGQFKPANLAQDYAYELTCIDEFENTMTKRTQGMQMLQVVGSSPMQNEVNWRAVTERFFKDNGYQDAGELLKSGKTQTDAERIARMENLAIYQYGTDDQPEPQEDHEAHIRTHTWFIDNIKILPKEQRNPANLAKLELHIQLHEQIQQQSQMAAQQQQAPPEAVGGPATPAQQVSDEIAATMGGANASTVGV